MVEGLQFRIGWLGETRRRRGSKPCGYLERNCSRFGEQEMQSPDLRRSVLGGFRKQQGGQELGQNSRSQRGKEWVELWIF